MYSIFIVIIRTLSMSCLFLTHHGVVFINTLILHILFNATVEYTENFLLDWLNGNRFVLYVLKDTFF